MKTTMAALVCALLLLGGCAGRTGQAEAAGERAFFAMDTFMTLRAYGANEALLDAAQARVEALEAALSVTREDSEVARLNRAGSARLSEESAALLRRALELCARTEGALDISVYPVVRAWGFTGEDYRVPEPEELAALLERVDYRAVEIARDGTVTLPEGMEIDLGGVAKGWAGDCLAALLREAGVESAVLALGGNVQTLGSKPDGSAWNVAVQDPEGEGLLGVLPVEDAAVVTSGGYERYFVDEAGNLWWHIMDPSTGRPADSGLISVTVVGREGVVCDALSTALFVLGEERAAALWREQRDFELVLVTRDGRLLLTPGLFEIFQPAPDLRYQVEEIPEAAP